MYDVEQDQQATASPTAATWTWPQTAGRWGLVALFAVIVVAYAVGSWLALLLIEASGLDGVFFIPAGITVGFLLRLPWRFWWVVLLGAGLTEFGMDLTGGYMLTQSIGFTAANVIEPLIGAAIVTIACGVVDLARRRHVLWFIFGAVIAAPAVAAAFRAGADRLFGSDDVLATFAQWWLGDALGVVLVGSAILAWGSSPDRRSLWSMSGGVLIAGSTALSVGVVAFTDLPLVFGVLIGVIGAAVAFGVRAVAITSLAITFAIAIALTRDVEPLIVGLTSEAALVLIKLQLAIFALAGLLVASESHERATAMRAAARSALESEARERERKRNHEVAIRVQRGLLPDRPLSKPGIDIAARYEAASDVLEVGGDWYDTIELRDGRVGLAVGDIVGHGVEAAISMGHLRAALSALALHNDEPASLLMELDEFVGGPSGTSYATVFYAIVDLGEETVTYASAGHPPALLVSPDGATEWLDQGQTGPLHGHVSNRRQASARLRPGMSLVMYSDGLIEQRSESLSVGLDRLKQFASPLGGRTPEDVCNELFARLVSDPPLHDDVVLLVMRNAMDSREYYEVFPAKPEELRNLRSSLRSWIDERDVPAAVGDDLLIAVGEAAANTARHAYRDAISGNVTVRITLVDDVLNVEVSDTGRWRDPLDEEAYPGLGTEIIQSLTDGLQVDKTSLGTHVTFRISISRNIETDAIPVGDHE